MPVPEQKRRSAGGAPAWIVTFADLATLLLTFFILLLSFAEMDVEKYRAMANSMAGAFGSSKVLGDAVGGSPLTLIESDRVSLPSPEPDAVLPPDQPTPAEQDASVAGPLLLDQAGEADRTDEVPEGVVELASRLITELETEVATGALNINYDTENVVIRFSEDATFQSGQATIKPGMVAIIERVVDVLSDCGGDVLVAGYTDDRPIVSNRYRSNWDLSAARAVSVVHELVLNRQVPAERVTAAGRAETNPLVANDTPENRARNRRVEISIRNPECEAVETGRDEPVDIRIGP